MINVTAQEENLRLLMENVTIVLSSSDSLTDKSKFNEKINLNKSFYVKCGPWNLRNSQEEKSIPLPVDDLRRGTRQKERRKERERQTTTNNVKSHEEKQRKTENERRWGEEEKAQAKLQLFKSFERCPFCC
ncbi:hypothetical protein RUM43_001880 [Polyplax serrata]|uniref:Uncharacterized protein n=1 Tax=Polyplax serrata TaxID=468196 RepID=A0AAN8SF31_POLSC